MDGAGVIAKNSRYRSMLWTRHKNTHLHSRIAAAICLVPSAFISLSARLRDANALMAVWTVLAQSIIGDILALTGTWGGTRPQWSRRKYPAACR